MWIFRERTPVVAQREQSNQTVHVQVRHAALSPCKVSLVRTAMTTSGFYRTETHCGCSTQTPRCQVTRALRMKHWSPRQQQEAELEWQLCMSSRLGRSGLPARPWQPAYGAWSRPTNALRSAASHWSDTTSCFTMASLALVSEEQEPRRARLAGRCHGSSMTSWSAALWWTQSLTHCFWSGKEGDELFHVQRVNDSLIAWYCTGIVID